MNFLLTEADLERELGSETARRGFAVWASDLVGAIDIAKEGTRLSASVHGSRSKPYSQTIALDPHGGRIRILGYCTCPMQRNCKHVAAVLYEYINAGAPAASSAGIGPEVVASLSRVPPPGTHDRESVQRTAAAPLVALPKALEGWLDRLVSAACPTVPADHKRPSYNERKTIYLLDAELSDGRPTPAAGRIRVVRVRLRKDGTYNDPRPYDPDQAIRTVEGSDRHLTETDHEVLRDLAWLRRRASSFGNADIALGPDATSRRVLETLLNSGTLHLGGIHGPLLRRGPDTVGRLVWVLGEHGLQRLEVRPSAPGSDETEPNAAFDAVLPLAPPCYLDRSNAVIGAIETGLPARLAAEAARSPSVSAVEAMKLSALMQERLGSLVAPIRNAETAPADGEPAPAPLLPLPETAQKVETVVVAPIPRLHLKMSSATLKGHYRWYARDERHMGEFQIPLATLSFDYGGVAVALEAPAQTVERVEADKLTLMPRDQKAEISFAALLERHFRLKRVSAIPFEVRGQDAHAFYIAPPDTSSIQNFLDSFDDMGRYLTFSTDVVPKLVAAGWQVTFSEDYAYRVAEGDAEWWAEVGETSGIDWLSFELGIEFEGQRINLVPHLHEIISSLSPKVIAFAFTPGEEGQFLQAMANVKTFHRLPDGRMLPIPGARLAPILRSLLELIGPRSAGIKDGKVRLHRADAALLARFAGDTDKSGLAWAAGADRLIELGRNLQRGRNLEKVLPPKSFKAELRPYQLDGLSWLDFLRGAGFGGVLADDMGLGKTVQTLAFLANEKAQRRLDKPALIVAPTSVLPNWMAEAERFASDLSVLPLRGLDRKQLFGEIGRHDVVLTTYPLLARDHEVLLGHEFHIAILDEAQAIKNPKATVSLLAHRINARHRLALTGTPLENNLGEVWSLFEFLSPGLLGDESTFRRTFRTPIEKHGDQAAQGFLSRRLKPFMLRRTKEAVAPELPPKTEIVERIRLEGGQRDLYETVRSLMHAKVRDEIARKGLAKSHIIFLDALLKLRQICCDPRLLKMPQARKVKESAKLDRLMELVPQMVGEGRRILLFSQFTSMLDLIQAELKKRHISFVELTGDTVDRATPVKQFQAGKVPLFLLSLKAGGTGLNLTAADTVIHYDPWWNPAVENQATDRAYRIGQDKPVFVHKLIVEEGIEEAIELLKGRKAALADALFAGTSKKGLDLTEADISALFAPLDGRDANAPRKTPRKAA